ncbi:ABC-three component system middle component 1 [Priestia sp. D51]
MDIFNSTNNRLIEKGFESIDLLEIENLGAVTYKSSINYVVMKKIHNHQELKNIKSYAAEIRNILLSQKINIWNAYLFFCVSENINYETFFMVERDTKSLRKYVIRNDLDLDRIPFIDNHIGYKKIDPNVTTNSEENPYLTRIFDFITTHNGRQNKFSPTEVEASIKMIIDMVDKRYES